MKQVLLTVLGLCLFLTISFAQGPHQHKRHHGKLSAEAKAELETFHKEKVYPVKKAAHDKMTATFSAEDLAFLEQKRAEGKALHEETRALRKEMKGARKNGTSKEEMKATYAPIKEKYAAFMESMKPFMERNKEAIVAAAKSLKAEQEGWRTEKKAILDKHLSEEDKAKMAERKERMKEKLQKRGEKRGKDKGDFRKMKMVKFVLWDGEMKTRKACKKGGKDCDKGTSDSDSGNSGNSRMGALDGSQGMTLTNYPNPAINQTTVIFELTNTTKKANLIITDSQGKQVWKKHFNKLNAGEHKVDVDLKKLPNGQYFYTLETDDNQMTKTLIVNK